jgi:hypothetical protein
MGAIEQIEEQIEAAPEVLAEVLIAERHGESRHVSTNCVTRPAIVSPGPATMLLRPVYTYSHRSPGHLHPENCRVRGGRTLCH